MESIEKLREYGHDCCARVDDAIHDYCDEIEREISERYMLLPMDADGVPIHVGDELCGYGHPKGGVQVAMVSESCIIVREDLNHNPAKHGLLWSADETRHVKPRTVEDVLKEFGDWYKHVAGGCDEPGIIAKYADELRSMVVGE